jgi:hypothetical protein
MSGMRELGKIPATMAGAVGMSLLLMAAPVAAAGPPMTGTGTAVIESIEITPIRNAGGNRIETRTLTGRTIDGTLDGTFVQHVTGVIHPNGLVTFHGVLLFTGTVEGCGWEEGTLILGLSGRGEAGMMPVTEASVRVINQAANTLLVTGQGTVFQEGPQLGYEIRYICR